jgi:hypothetical protein
VRFLTTGSAFAAQAAGSNVLVFSRFAPAKQTTVKRRLSWSWGFLAAFGYGMRREYSRHQPNSDNENILLFPILIPLIAGMIVLYTRSIGRVIFDYLP